MSTASRQPSTDSEPSSAALTTAVRAAARFDPSLVSFGAGLLAAIPVASVLGGALAFGAPVAGVTMGAGAMLVGIAWRVSGGRPPLAVMATDAGVMALSTFVGCVTGSVSWLHIALLCVWSGMAGLLVVLGPRGGAIGTQAIIAVVVFGRFSEPAGAALGLAGLVLAGGLAQVAFLTVIRWPLPLRVQRRATADAYRALSRLAAGPLEASTLPAAAALDEADASLSSPAMFGDPALMTMRSLTTEGHRLRVQLLAIHTLLRQHEAHAEVEDDAVRSGAEEALTVAASALNCAAQAIEGHDTADRLEQRVRDLDAQAEAHAAALDGVTTVSPERTAELHLARRLEALAGQLRAVQFLAPAAGKDGRLRSRRPYRPATKPLRRLRAGVAQVRVNMSLDSPAGRHALRLAVVVPIADLIARELPVSRSYWLVVAAATVLRPEFGATFTRGAERAGGTCLGVAIASALTVALHPAGAATVVVVGALAWAAYSLFPASFAIGYAFITAVVVFLINVITPDTLAAATARLVDTLIGGAIGLIAYALWPTWSRIPAWQSLADLVGAERAYVASTLTTVIDARQPGEAEVRNLSRRARLARTTAEATVARSLSEPTTRRIDANRSQQALGALRRLIQAAHVLRLDSQEERDRRPLPELGPLRSGLDDLLGAVETSLRAGPDDPPPAAGLPDLRAAYRRFARKHAGEAEAMSLLGELDEIVDAANGLAVISGLEEVDDDNGSARMSA
jgi:uncharacterized membrane protein YccC